MENKPQKTKINAKGKSICTTMNNIGTGIVKF